MYNDCLWYIAYGQLMFFLSFYWYPCQHNRLFLLYLTKFKIFCWITVLSIRHNGSLSNEIFPEYNQQTINFRLFFVIILHIYIYLVSRLFHQLIFLFVFFVDLVIELEYFLSIIYYSMRHNHQYFKVMETVSINYLCVYFVLYSYFSFHFRRYKIERIELQKSVAKNG